MSNLISSTVDVSVQGEHVWQTFKKGGLACSLMWVDGESYMVLYPQHSIAAGGFPIHQNNAYLWVTPQCLPTRKMADEAFSILMEIGATPTATETFALLDLITLSANELLKMPPCPQRLLPKTLLHGSEATVTLAGQTREFIVQ